LPDPIDRTIKEIKLINPIEKVMKITRWGAFIVAFLVSCVIATVINDAFNDFGYENCEKVYDTLDALRKCRSAVKEQTSSGFGPMFLVVWFVTAVIALTFAERQN